MAFRVPNVFATFEKRAPDPISRNLSICNANCPFFYMWRKILFKQKNTRVQYFHLKILEPNKLRDRGNFFKGKEKTGESCDFAESQYLQRKLFFF